MKFIKNKILIFFIIWAVFTLTLLSWWIYFSLKQLTKLEALNISTEDQVLRYQKMLTYEGITLVFCLFIGAASIFYFILKENKSLRERKNFLSLFTHDLKTTISALRLKLEKLDGKSEDDIKQIRKIGNKLSQQLQNALQFSIEKHQKPILEELDFSKQILYIKNIWPDLNIVLKNNISVCADTLLLRGILTNIIQNAIDHAQASEIEFSLNQSRSKYTGVDCYSPKSKKFDYDIEKFKKNKRAGQSVDGSGLGLRLSEKMMAEFGGFIDYSLKNEILVVTLFFKNKGALNV